jgi:UDP-3-O-[3-hydroxymyristoyl] N-acetylglucosamine deacetylase
VVTFEGTGLRSGRAERVTLRAREGPFVIGSEGAEVARSRLVLVDAQRATTVRAGDAVVATVEHLLAACAALGLHEGLAVGVSGGEIPLLDGAAAAFAASLGALGIPCTAPPLRVLRDETIEFEGSVYRFRRAAAATVAVTIAFDDPRLDADAAWDGTAKDFVDRIAPARTFAFGHEVETLVRHGQASHVDPSSAVVLAPDAILASGAPFTRDEPARHKLLDLMGDLFVYGGPPMGHVHAYRPGHRATHEVMRRATAAGVVA